MLGATAFLLGVAGLFGSAAMMGAENRSSSAGGYGIPSETDNDVSAQVRAVHRKWSGTYNNQRGEWYNQLGPKDAWPEQRKKIWWQHVYEDEGVPVSEGYLNHISGWDFRYSCEYGRLAEMKRRRRKY